ncbi:MAG TPA: hypothetical protein VOA78_11270 [Candidatus Dormibacteraeota bacterium]|nr:hypothetical protein [Candidatus Dormibacteraeota bacterium]
MPNWIRLAEITFVTALVAILVVSWREDRRDRAQLATQLAAAQQVIAAADARQHDRDTQLQQSLAAIAQSKRTVQSPKQILADLPNQLPLPTPLAFGPKDLPDTPQAKASATQNAPVLIAPEDLKPLYDFTLDCQACQSKLTAAQADLADEKTKTTTLAKERDAALQAARGGSLLRRVARAAKWFAIGAAAGAIAAKAAH